MFSISSRRIGFWSVVAVGVCVAFPARAAVESTTAVSSERPVIDVREANQEGGVVEEGTVVKVQFAVANRGHADLELRRVKPDCGCSIAHWDKVVKPGATSTIKAELHTEYFRGLVIKHFTVFSNDPVQPELRLGITARVTPLVNIIPGPAALLSIEDQAVHQEFTLERNGGQAMKIVQVIPNAPFIQAEATPLPGVGRYKLAVTVTPEAPLGRSVVPVVVRTDTEKANMVTLVLTVDRGIVAVPPMVFYGLLPPKSTTPTQAAITISRHNGHFHVKEATVDDPKLEAWLETVHAGEEYRVTVTYAGGWETGLVKKTLTVITDDPKQPVLKIPIQAVVQAGGDIPAPVVIR